MPHSTCVGSNPHKPGAPRRLRYRQSTATGGSWPLGSTRAHERVDRSVSVAVRSRMQFPGNECTHDRALEAGVAITKAAPAKAIYQHTIREKHTSILSATSCALSGSGRAIPMAGMASHLGMALSNSSSRQNWLHTSHCRATGFPSPALETDVWTCKPEVAISMAIIKIPVDRGEA